MNDHLVWLDAEMTGLDIDKDVLIEVAALVTDSELNVLGAGVDVVIHADETALGSMVEIVREMHDKSGLTDAVRALYPTGPRYTWWDYRAGAWAGDQGLRIDHLLLSPQAADRLSGAGIDRGPRGWERASDHAPVWRASGKPAASHIAW